MPIFAIVAIGICIFRCRKKGAQAPDMFLGAIAMLALGLMIDMNSVAAPIEGALDQMVASAKNAF